jgi:A-macroglobulin TED domain
LQRTTKSVLQVEAKARQYIHLGYQRLLGFEVAGGGFDWFGRPPANRVLTAYGLMEFEDMARVHDVDPRLIARTRAWLIGKRDSDGSWAPEGHRLHDDPTGGQRDEEMARLSTTAYIAWAVFRGMTRSNEAAQTERFICRHEPSEINDPYVLAVVANALLAIDPSSGRAEPYLERLQSLRRSSADGKQIWWEQPGSAATGFYSAGRCGAIETTALSALAFMTAQTNSGSVRGALNWLITQKDASGTWHSTQATVLALKALLTGTEMADTQDRRLEVRWDNEEPREIVIPSDQADVLQQIDLSSGLTPGQHHLSIVEKDDSATVYQVAFRYHVPGTPDQAKPDPIAIEVDYDRNELTIRDTVPPSATRCNKRLRCSLWTCRSQPDSFPFRTTSRKWLPLERSPNSRSKPGACSSIYVAWRA